MTVRLSGAQKVVLTCAFVPMVATGVAGGIGTYTNIGRIYGEGTALGAVAAGEGATAVLALVMLGLTMLGQSSPAPVRIGLWCLPAAAAVMAATASGTADMGRTIVYAITPMGMCVAAEGMAFLARRIVVHLHGRDAEAERRSAATVRALAYHRSRAANHPDERARARSAKASWRLAKRAGTGDVQLGARLLDVQRERMTDGANAALAGMFALPVTPERHTTGADAPAAVTPAVTPATPALESAADRATDDAGPEPYVTDDVDDVIEEDAAAPFRAVDPLAPTLADVAAASDVDVPTPGVPLSDGQLVAVLRFLRYSATPPLSYRQAAGAFRDAGFTSAEQRIRDAWAQVQRTEETAS